MESSLILDNGKYEIIQKENSIKVLRYGEKWRDLTGDNLFYFLLDLNSELECKIHDLSMKLMILDPNFEYSYTCGE